MAVFSPNTVTVQVFRNTRVVAAQALEYPIYMVPHNLTTSAVDSYSSATAALQAGAATNSSIAKLMTGTFGGIAPPQLAKIGRMNITTTDLVVGTIPAVDEDVKINVKINGTEKVISYTIQSGDTTTEAAAGLEAALTTEYPVADIKNPVFSVSTNTVTATYDADTYPSSFGYNSFDLDDRIGTPHVLIENKSSVTPTAALTAIMPFDSNFFFVGAESHDPTEVDALATFVQANDLMFVSSTSDVDVYDNTSTSNIALTLQNKNYDQTVLTYSSQADWAFPEGMVVGAWAGIKPYEVNSLNLRTLPGLVADIFTSESPRQTLAERNTNYYWTENGTANFYEGWVSATGTEFADTVRFSLWSKLTTRAAIFNLMKGRSDAGRAVPYNDLGITEIEQVVWNDMVNVAIAGGTCATGYSINSTTGARINLNPIVDFGTRADQTNANIGARILADCDVEMVYVSPIHHVNVRVYVILNRNPE